MHLKYTRGSMIVTLKGTEKNPKVPRSTGKSSNSNLFRRMSVALNVIRALQTWTVENLLNYVTGILLIFCRKLSLITFALTKKIHPPHQQQG